MAKAFAAVALVALLLAGCSSDPGTEEGVAPVSDGATYTTVLGQRDGPLVTDTFHLLEWPSMTTRAPTDDAPLRLTIDPFAEQLATGYFDETWVYTPESELRGLAGTMSVWVEVTGTILNDPSPTNGDCFWQFSLTIGSLETGTYHGMDCVAEPATVASGIRQLVVPFDFPSAVVPAGTPLQWEMHTQDFSRSPGAKVEVLTYSTQYDSTVTLLGLELPVDGSLVLQAAA